MFGFPPSNLIERARWYRAKSAAARTAAIRSRARRLYAAAAAHDVQARNFALEATRIDAIVAREKLAEIERLRRRVVVIAPPRGVSTFVPPGGWPPVPGSQYQTVEDASVRSGPRPAGLPTVSVVTPDAPAAPFDSSATTTAFDAKPPFDSSATPATLEPAWYMRPVNLAIMAAVGVGAYMYTRRKKAS